MKTTIIFKRATEVLVTSKVKHKKKTKLEVTIINVTSTKGTQSNMAVQFADGTCGSIYLADVDVVPVE